MADFFFIPDEHLRQGACYILFEAFLIILNFAGSNMQSLWIHNPLLTVLILKP
jgi:hypothetical protein